MRNYHRYLVCTKLKHLMRLLQKAAQLVADGGYGHTSSLYVHPAETEKIAKHAAAMKTCRVLINTPSSHGGIGDLYNFKTGSVPYTWMWIMGWKLCIRERRSKTSA